MRTISLLLSSLFFLISEATITPPSDDPFYDQPSNISDYDNGEVVRSRSVSNELVSFLSLPVDVSVQAVHQYFFRTTNSLGDAAGSVVTLMEPYNSDPSKLLGYQAFYDSANVDCSPSYTLRADYQNLGLTVSGLNVSEDIPFIAAALNLGWWVFTTDYEGLNAEFTVGLQTGHAVLDSTRAVLSAGPSVGLSSDPVYALWGYSGGSLACTWAAELQPSYAPELNYAGVAVGGTTPNISSVLETINNGSDAGLAFSGIYGQSKAFPNLTEWMSSNLVSSKSDQFYNIANQCLAEATTDGDDQDIYSYFENGEDSFYDDVPASIFMWSGQLGLHGTPTAPIFLYKAIGDEISPIADTDYIVSKYCDEGATIEYHRDLVGDHETEAISGSASALAWLADRLNGESVSSGCTTEDVILSSLSIETLVVLGEELFSLLETTLGGLL